MVKVLAEAAMGAVSQVELCCRKITCYLCSLKSMRIKYTSAACCEEVQLKS